MKSLQESQNTNQVLEGSWNNRQSYNLTMGFYQWTTGPRQKKAGVNKHLECRKNYLVNRLKLTRTESWGYIYKSQYQS